VNPHSNGPILVHSTYVRGKPLSGFHTTAYFGPNFSNFCYWKNSTLTVKNNSSCSCSCWRYQCQMSSRWHSLIIWFNSCCTQSIKLNAFDWLSHCITDVSKPPKFNGVPNTKMALEAACNLYSICTIFLYWSKHHICHLDHYCGSSLPIIGPYSLEALTRPTWSYGAGLFTRIVTVTVGPTR